MEVNELDDGVDTTGDRNDYNNESYMSTMFVRCIIPYYNNG